MREFPAAMTTASRRGRARTRRFGLAGSRAMGLRLAGFAAMLAAGQACKLDQNGVPPPLDRIAFPASALVDPDGRWLYVANSNSDLRYNDGTLVAVDLDGAIRDRFGEVGQAAPTWPVCPAADRVRPDSVDVALNPADQFPCCWDFLDHSILNCDERLYIPPQSTVKIGSFAAGMQFQRFVEPDCDPTLSPNEAHDALRKAHATRHDCNANCPGEPVEGRLFIGVRGNSSLTYVDTRRVADPVLGTRPVFTCSDPTSSDPNVCQVTQTIPNASPADVQTPIHVPDEPYALVLDSSKDLLYVGNLRGDINHPQTGGISLFDVSRPVMAPRAAPVFIGPSSSLFNPDLNGNFGITSLTLRDNGRIYACSRYGTNVVDVLTTLDAGNLCDQSHDDIAVFGGSDVYATPLLGAEIRGIQFLPDAKGIPAEDGNMPPEATRAFVLQRVPPALIEFDASTDPRAFGNFPSAVLETCTGPTFLQAYDAGEGTRLYVTCFDAGQIYVFDPYVPRLISVINAGRGPAGLAFPLAARADRPERLAYVVGFSANDIPVVDLTPGSGTQFHVVQRIGFPSLTPR
jgi:hypothetical protein